MDGVQPAAAGETSQNRVLNVECFCLFLPHYQQLQTSLMNRFTHLSAIDTLIIPDANWGFANVNAAAARQSEKKLSAERAAAKVFPCSVFLCRQWCDGNQYFTGKLGDILSYDMSSQETDCPVPAGDVLSSVGGHGRLVGGK